MAKWVLIGFALFLFVLLWLNIKVIVEARVGRKNSGVYIEVILLRSLFRKEFDFKNLKTGLPPGAPGAGGGKSLDKGGPGKVSAGIPLRLKQGMMFRRELAKRPWLKRMIRSAVGIREFSWRTVVGLDDAMYTALAVGVIWSVKGWILALVSGWSSLRRQRIEVTPSFGLAKFESTWRCEVLFRLGCVLFIVPMIYILSRRAASSIMRKAAL